MLVKSHFVQAVSRFVLVKMQFYENSKVTRKIPIPACKKIALKILKNAGTYCKHAVNILFLNDLCWVFLGGFGGLWGFLVGLAGSGWFWGFGGVWGVLGVFSKIPSEIVRIH